MTDANGRDNPGQSVADGARPTLGEPAPRPRPSPLVGLLGLAIIAFGVWLGYAEIRYALEGAEASGTVTAMTIHPPSFGKTQTTFYHVAYAFRPGGGSQSEAGEGEVAQEEWSRLTVGGPIAIEYQLSDPAGANRPIGMTHLGVIPMILVVGWFLEFAYARALWLARRQTRPADGVGGFGTARPGEP